MTSSDIMMIQSGFYYHTDDVLKCETTINNYYTRLKRSKPHLTDDEQYEEACRLVHTKNKCDRIVDKSIYEVDGFEYNTCMCNFIHPELDLFLTYFTEYETHGNWPYKGTIADQPNYIVEVIKLLQSLKNKKEIEDNKAAQKVNKAR